MNDPSETATPESGQPIILRRAPAIAMHVRASNDDPEVDIRTMCSGLIPQEGERYVWVCTGVTQARDQIDVAFQLQRLED